MTALLRRVVRSAPALTCLATVLTVVICVGAGAVAVWWTASADAVVARTVQQTTPSARQLTVTYTGVTGASVEPGDGAEIRAALSPAFRAAYRTPTPVVSTAPARYRVLDPGSPIPSDDRLLTVDGMPGLDDLVTVEKGRLPRPGHPVRRLPPAAADVLGYPAAPVIEVVVPDRRLGPTRLRVGDLVQLDQVDYTGSTSAPPVAAIVGTYRPSGPMPTRLDDASYPRAPTVIPRDTGPPIIRTGALAADISTVLSQRWREAPSIEWTLDYAGPATAAQARALVGEALALNTRSWPKAAAAESVLAQAGLVDVLGPTVDELDASDRLATVPVAMGAATGVVCLVLLAAVMAIRRRRLRKLLRARGASDRQLLTLVGAEAAVAALVGLAAGVSVVLATADGVPAGGPLAVVAAAAGCCLVVLTTVGLTSWSSDEPADTRSEQVSRWRRLLPAAWRLAAFGLSAVGLAVMLQRNDLRSGDPVLALVPPLVAVTVGVLTAGLLQYAVRWSRHLAGRRAGVLPLVTVTRAAAVAGAAVPAATVVVLASSIAVFTVAVSDTIDRGTVGASWQQVGSDVTVRSPAVDEELASAADALPGVTSTALVSTRPNVGVVAETGAIVRATLVAADPAGMARLTKDAPVSVAVPRSTGSTLRVAVSPDLVGAGEQLSLQYGSDDVAVEVADVADPVPGVPLTEPYVVADVSALKAATDERVVDATVLLIRGDVGGSQVQQVVRRAGVYAQVLDRRAWLDERLSSGKVSRSETAFTVSRLAAVAAALAAGLLTLVLSGPGRRRTTATLLALGADRRTARVVATLELLPTLLVAGVVGSGLGLLLARLSSGALGVATLTGSTGDLVVRPDAGSMLTTGLAVTVLTAVVVAVAAWLAPFGQRGEDFEESP